MRTNHIPDPQGTGVPGASTGDPASPDYILQVQELTKRYGRTTALKQITFNVQAGESLALWGPNGAGKSTLIKSVLGLVGYEGRILVDGVDARRQGKQARSRLGYVPQEAIFYDMGLETTLSFYGRLRHIERGRVPLLIERLGLSDHAQKRISALSGGLKQRLALALALLSDPPLLLLDEPTANLDMQSRRDYLALLAELRNEGKTVIFASHRLEEVEILAKRVLVIEDGRLSQELTPVGLRRVLSPQIELTLWIAEEQRLRALTLLQGQGLDGHLNGRGTVVIQANSEEKVRALNMLEQHGIAVLDFETERGDLWS